MAANPWMKIAFIVFLLLTIGLAACERAADEQSGTDQSGNSTTDGQTGGTAGQDTTTQ